MSPNVPPHRPHPRVSARHRPSLSWLTVALAGLLAIAGLNVSSLQTVASAQPIEVVADTTRTEPGVVRIDTTVPFQGAIGMGTGVVLSPDGIVLTNNHVIRGATVITATNVGNGQSYQADVLGYDRKSDIAVLQLRDAAGLAVAPTTDSSQVRVGDSVTGVGFPEGGGLTRAPGTVRALDRSIVANDELTGSAEELSGLIEFEADIRPGDSGGPLVGDDGEVIGIVTAASNGYEMVRAGGFAVPLNQALPIADAVRAGTASGSIHVGPTAILGLGVGAGRDESGVPVQGVLRGSPAERAGLAGGDVITAVDAVPIGDATALTDVLDQRRPGDTITLTVLDRERTAQSVPVTLAAGPPN